MTVYLDLFVLLNFAVDFLLLAAAEQLTGCPPKVGRTAAAAGLGGIYGGVCLVPGFHFLGNCFWRLAALTGMSAICFGWNRGTVRKGGLYLLLSMALGGMVLGIHGKGIPGLVLSGAGVYLLSRIGLGGFARGGRILPVTLQYGGRKLTVSGLWDTGNQLKDPLTGEAVLVADPEVAEKLTGLTKEQLCHPLETLSQRTLPGLRLIPYRSVGQPGAMLLALRCSEVRVGNRKQGRIIAFSPEALGTSGTYQMLIGGAV